MKNVVHIEIPQNQQDLRTRLRERLKNENCELVITEGNEERATVQSVEVAPGNAMFDVATGENVMGPALAEGMQGRVSAIELEWRRERGLED
jgi:hypothetical protein